MSRFGRGARAFVLLLCCAAPFLRENAAGDAAGAPAAPDAPAAAPSQTSSAPAVLSLEGLPAALYDGDTLTLSVCVERPASATADVALELALLPLWREGEAAAQRAHETSPPVLRLKPGEKSVQSFTRETRGLERLRLELTAVRGTMRETAGRIDVRLLRTGDAWPALRCVDGRWCEADGALVVPVAVRAAKAEDRRFALLRWVLGGEKAEAAARAKPAGAVDSERTRVFVPENWARGRELADGWSTVDCSVQRSVPPVLELFVALQTALQNGNGAVKTVAILLPPEDLARGTDPRTYTVVLEALLQRLRAAGVERTSLVAPFQYGTPDAVQGALASAVADAARRNGAEAAEASEYQAEALWRVAPEARNVFSQSPNAEGWKMIEQGMLKLVK